MKGLILLTGPAGSGKDTFAEYLRDRHGATILALADDLKRKTAQHFNLLLSFFYDRDKKDAKLGEIQKTPRELLIEYSKVLRQEDELVFCKSLENQFHSGYNVISDVRYTRELKFFKERYECAIIYIQRDVKNVGDDIELKPKDADFIVKNDKTPFDGEYILSQCEEINL